MLCWLLLILYTIVICGALKKFTLNVLNVQHATLSQSFVKKVFYLCVGQEQLLQWQLGLLQSAAGSWLGWGSEGTAGIPFTENSRYFIFYRKRNVGDPQKHCESVPWTDVSSKRINQLTSSNNAHWQQVWEFPALWCFEVIWKDWDQCFSPHQCCLFCL